MITIEQLKALPPETEIVITKPEDDYRWNYRDMAYLKGKVLTVEGLTLGSDEDFISIPRKEPVGCSWYLQPEWLSLKEEDGLGRLKRTIAALRSEKRAKYKTEHDYNKHRQITQAKYDRIKYRARCEGADTVSNDNRFMYNGFLYQQDYGTGASYKGNRSTCCMRTRVNKIKLKDVLTRSADTTTIVRRKLSDLPEINSEEDYTLLRPNLSERVHNFAVENTKGTTLEEDRKINKDWTASHYDNNYTLTEDDIEKGFVRVDAYFVNRMWKINSWDDTGAAFHSLKTLTRIGNNKNTLKRELIALAKQTKALCKLHGVTDEDLL